MEDRIDLIDGAFWGRNPHEELAWLRADAPVWQDPRHGVWGVATYDLVKQVATQPKTFSSAQGIRPDYPSVPSMIDSDDPAHWQRRRLVNKGFTPRRVRDQDAIRRTARLLIDAVADRGEFDLVADVAAWLPLITIGDLLGVAPPDREQLLRWSDDLMSTLGSSDPELRKAQISATAGYFEYASSVVRARRESPTDDLMSVLVAAEVDGHRLTDPEIQYESMLLLIGGDETTRHVISGGAYQVLLERERWEALIADRSLLGSAVEEMLRWVSPVKNMTRTATEDTELAGQHIRTGEKLLLLYPSANRDEAVFKDPFTFDIRRTPNEHVAFGHGPHFCLGASLARLELQVLFEELLDRLPDLRLVDLTEPCHRPANFVSGLETLAVALAEHPVDYTLTAGIAVITINRPDARNAINGEVARGIEAAIDRLEDDHRAALGVLTGAGPVFCAGADLKAIGRGEGTTFTTERGGFAGFVRRERSKPIIAAVDGPALAGGAELVLACDLVVASTAAAFGLPEVKRALIASAGGLFRLPRALPRNIAMQLALTGRPISAERAAQFGLVNELVEPGEALAAALALAEQVAANAPIAMRQARRVILAAENAHDDELWRITDEAQAMAVASEDFKEGVRAFVEKRAPRWTGRPAPTDLDLPTDPAEETRSRP